MADSQTSTYAKTHQLAGRLLRFDLTAESEALHKSAAGGKSGRTAKTLVKEGPLSVTMVAIRAGASLEEHHVAGPTTIHCLRGRLKLTTEAGVTDLGEGTLVALDAGVAHSVAAVEDCTLLLTLTQQQA